MVVRKRDGRLQEFDQDKILGSIKAAALAVECKDPDIQKRAIEITSLKNQLIQHGFDEDEAEEQAEIQFDGYLEDGIYTEYDEDEAEEILSIVSDSVDSLELDEDGIVETCVIQDIVEKALMMTDHAKTAKEYIIKRANRERVREMNTSLMKSFTDLTFGKSQDVETKRENANIDGDSSMGTMLKYGSEGAKKFNLLYVVPPVISNMHSNGDIHIHDLDFYSLTETCTSDDTMITIKNKNNKVLNVRADSFDSLLEGHPVDTVIDVKDIQIVSKGKFVAIKNCVRHSSVGKRMMEIITQTGNLKVTSEHRVPVDRNGTEVELRAEEIRVGDYLLWDAETTIGSTDTEGSRVESKSTLVTCIKEIEYNGYVYDFETDNHYFAANGFTVHNCCQIDLDKLFENGFNTGHGFLREPGEIRSYAALACIAIQSNQNDMHKRVA